MSKDLFRQGLFLIVLISALFKGDSLSLNEALMRLVLAWVSLIVLGMVAASTKSDSLQKATNLIFMIVMAITLGYMIPIIWRQADLDQLLARLF